MGKVCKRKSQKKSILVSRPHLSHIRFDLQQSKKQKANPSAPASEETSHILGIIASLFTNLASESPARVRLLTKFVETNYEKVDRLLDVRESVRVRLKTVEKIIEEEKKVNIISMNLVCPWLMKGCVPLTNRKCNESRRTLEWRRMSGIPEDWKVDYSLSKSLTILSAGYAWKMMV